MEWSEDSLCDVAYSQKLNTSDTSRNPWSPQNALKILGHEYEVVRHSTQAEANIQTPLGSRLSSAVH